MGIMGNRLYLQQMTPAIFFAPQLMIGKGTTDISFYQNAFGATENFCLRNEDGTVHVAELQVADVVFHVHEVMHPRFMSPEQYQSTTVLIGLFVPDVDKVMNQAVSAGATVVSPAKDYEYHYRQGEIKDPFGHYWLIQKRI